ncbi:hypothetical protein DSO57_1024788 [Entomophthora muscae]|uniref:Uncharacterized protein n=1 Tax=Entomophthora muscae TaxID=34485 RepID=A0ACC2T2Q6_9FUNG|nr:hypothetical protein DSO57_1024788 [Entomophthora muscae]
MNSFAFFASILAQAISAMPTTPSMLDMQDMFDIPFMPPMPKMPPMPEIPITATIKDNEPYLLSNYNFNCDGNSSLTITLSNESDPQAYLYPVFQKNQHIKLFKRTDGKYVKDNTCKKLPGGKNPGPEDLSVLAKYQIKKVLYTSYSQKFKNSVYVIPPKVSPGLVRGKPHKLILDIQNAYECRDKNNNIQQVSTNFLIAVTSNAHTQG